MPLRSRRERPFGKESSGKRVESLSSEVRDFPAALRPSGEVGKTVPLSAILPYRPNGSSRSNRDKASIFLKPPFCTFMLHALAPYPKPAIGACEKTLVNRYDSSHLGIQESFQPACTEVCNSNTSIKDKELFQYLMPFERKRSHSRYVNIDIH